MIPNQYVVFVSGESVVAGRRNASQRMHRNTATLKVTIPAPTAVQNTRLRSEIGPSMSLD